MRKIKFRGKEINSGRWVYGNYIKTPLTSEVMYTEPKDGWFFLCGKERHCISQNSCVFEVDVETIGEYTGLKDKNGKEIYEGDILLSELHDTDTGEITKDKFIIKFKDGCFFLYIIGTWLTENASITPFLPMCKMGHEYYPCEYEVLGNIYENPELLESEGK